jgi:type II secretory pathway component PulJ
MTILELLAALALMSALAVASVSWLRLAARDTARAGQQLNWSLASAAVLSLIRDDLQTGDFAGDLLKARVDPSGSILVRTRTRAAGGLVCAYRWDASDGALYRDEYNQTQDIDRAPAAPASASRLLLTGIGSLQFREDEKTKVLTVVLIGPAGRTAARSYTLP